MISTQDLKYCLVEYLNRVTTKKNNKYICPLCHSGEGANGTPAFSVYDDNTQFKCHACGASGDVIDLDRLLNGGDFIEAQKRLKEMFSISDNHEFKSPIQPQKQPIKEQTDYTDFFFKAHEKLAECDYLANRGISKELQDRFNIGYEPNWKHPKTPNSPTTPRIIIPTSQYSYLARDTRQEVPAQQQPYTKSKVGRMNIFNAECLEKEYCFVVEGEIDCLSVLQCGYNCIGLGSTTMINKLLDICKKKKPTGILIFSLDNDGAGQTWTKEISKFKEVGIKCMSISISGEEKDPNDLLIKNPEQLENNLKIAVDKALNMPENELLVKSFTLMDNQEAEVEELRPVEPIDIDDLTEKTILKSNVFEYLKSIDDMAERSDMVDDFLSKAKSLKLKCDFKEKLKSFDVLSDPSNTDKKKTLTIDLLSEYIKSENCTLKYDEIRHIVDISGYSSRESSEHIQENFPVILYDKLQHEYSVSFDKISKYMNVIATQNKFNPVLEMIQNTVWDGINRLEQVYNIFEIESDDKLSKILIKKWFMQCICGLHNNMDNPFSLDIVLIFQGLQGAGKTRFFEHLAINNKYFAEGKAIDTRNKDTFIPAVSSWICELGEIGSTMKKDIDSLKAFLTSSTDNFRMPYGATYITHARHTSFCGTTNDQQFLIDETGNRRFATVPLKSTLYLDYEKSIKPFETLQFWAEINYIVTQEIKENHSSYASCFRLNREEINALNERNRTFEKPLKGEEEVIDVLAELSSCRYSVADEYITVSAFKEQHDVLRKYDTRQIGKVLDKLGYPMIKMRIDGKPSRARRLPKIKEYVSRSL